MEFISVIAAAAGSFVVGAIWYMTLSKPWMDASGVAVGEDGKPANANDPVPYIFSFVAALLVAGMMRHVFEMGNITDVMRGAQSGFGVGAFFISPWIFLNNMFSDRGYTISAIDSGYAIVGCTAMGTILTLF